MQSSFLTWLINKTPIIVLLTPHTTSNDQMKERVHEKLNIPLREANEETDDELFVNGFHNKQIKR